jgi:uncharacterized membrane protein
VIPLKLPKSVKQVPSESRGKKTFSLLLEISDTTDAAAVGRIVGHIIERGVAIILGVLVDSKTFFIVTIDLL